MAAALARPQAPPLAAGGRRGEPHRRGGGAAATAARAAGGGTGGWGRRAPRKAARCVSKDTARTQGRRKSQNQHRNKPSERLGAVRALAEGPAAAQAEAPGAAASPQRQHALDGEIERLAALRGRVVAAGGDAEARLAALAADPAAKAFFARNSGADAACAEVCRHEGAAAECALRAVAAAGQGHVLDSANASPSALSGELEDWVALADKMRRVDVFYDALGGIVGYQLEALQQIRASETLERLTLLEEQDVAAAQSAHEGETTYYEPEGVDLAADESVAFRTAMDGLRALPSMAEIYPLGGAGDRLGLRDEATGEPLPVALLPYAGRSLLEGLVRDLTAREWLYFKCFGEQHVTPVAVMTSDAKGNSRRVTDLCEKAGWFGRGRQSFRLFEQPMVPVVDAEAGRWMASGALKAVMKPGGHGVIWKLASDDGVFDWLIEGQGRQAAIVRQISNPMAAVRTTLLSLAGVGASGRKPFGFASCDRAVGAAEGVNVLVERRDSSGGYSYGISNVEYTEFEKLGITDKPDANGKSRFPANTNVLYVDLPAVSSAARGGLAGGAFPGMIINLKKQIGFYDEIAHTERSVRGGRLECTMQNVADFLMERSERRLGPGERGDHGPFVLFNQRRFVTSSAKKQRPPGETKHLHQTPDGSFRDLQANAADMLQGAGVDLPPARSDEDYLVRGPSASVLFHPALGPLWEVVRQKVRGGRLGEGSELRLEIAEASVVDLDLEGSLLVEADSPLGTARGEDGAMVFDDSSCGRVILEGVTVRNAGVDWEHEGTQPWAARHRRKEMCSIELRGDSAFVARGVTFAGEAQFVVPEGMVMTVTQPDAEGELIVSTRKLEAEDRWRWDYTTTDDDVTLTLATAVNTSGVVA